MKNLILQIVLYFTLIISSLIAGINGIQRIFAMGGNYHLCIIGLVISLIIGLILHFLGGIEIYIESSEEIQPIDTEKNKK